MQFTDRGVKRLLDAVEQAKKKSLEIGCLDAPPEVVEIMTHHEYGAPRANLPRRSFLRSAIRDFRDKYNRVMKQLLTVWGKGDVSIEAVLTRLSAQVVGDIQQKIINGLLPPLKKATVDRKRRLGLPRPATALFATGRLYNSIKARLK